MVFVRLVWHPACAARCQPCPTLPASACALLCLCISSLELSCIDLQNLFPVGCTYSESPWPFLLLSRGLKDGRVAVRTGLCWTASMGFSRGMVGREWSGWWVWESLESRGGGGYFSDSVSEDPRSPSSSVRWILDIHSSPRLLQTDLTLQAGLWFLYLADWMLVLAVPACWQDWTGLGKARTSTAELDSVCPENFVRIRCFLRLNNITVWTLQVLLSLIHFLNETEG